MHWRPAELSGLGVPLAALVTSTVALVLVAADSPWWWASIVGAVAWCLVTGIAVAGWTQRETSIAVSHPAVVARITLLFAIGLAASHTKSLAPLFWTSIAVLVIGMTIEPVLVKMAPESGVAHLPGIGPLLDGRVLRVGSVVSMGVLAIGVLLDLTKAAVLWWALLALGQVCATAALGLWVLGARRRRSRHSRAVADAVAEYAPVYALYTGRRSGGAYQVQMWLPWLERLGAPFIIVTRHPSAVDVLSRHTTAPVVSCESWGDLDRVVVPSLRVALYVNSLGVNADFMTHRELRHVYLGHGESDKELSVHPMHVAYDTILVAGQAAIDRYDRAGVAIPRDRMIVVGRPQVDEIRVADRAGPGGEADGRHRPTVLYAPTWLGYNRASSYSSLPQGRAIVEQLLAAGLRVVFRPHPFSLERPAERPYVTSIDTVLERANEAHGADHQLGRDAADDSFAESANASDLMVCDISSVLTDYLQSGKPVAVVDAFGAVRAHPERHTDAAGAYVIDGDLGNLGQVLEQMRGTDPLREQRLSQRHYVLGDVGAPGERFLSVLRELAEPEAARSGG